MRRRRLPGPFARSLCAHSPPLAALSHALTSALALPCAAELREVVPNVAGDAPGEDCNFPQPVRESGLNLASIDLKRPQIGLKPLRIGLN